MKERLFKLCLSLSALSLFCWVIVSYTKLAVCASDSLKGVHYVLFLKNTVINRGDIVFIPHHPVRYVGEKSLSKRVLGLPGDRVSRDEAGIKVVSQGLDSKTANSFPLSLLEKTSQGEPLTPLSNKTIPEGYVFVAGDNPKSFDSRYVEFGLIEKEKIWGKAICTW